MSLRKHKDEETERAILRTVYDGPEPRTPETKPAPKADLGTECPKCGRRGRAEGHH